MSEKREWASKEGDGGSLTDQTEFLTPVWISTQVSTETLPGSDSNYIQIRCLMRTPARIRTEIPPSDVAERLRERGFKASENSEGPPDGIALADF